MQTATVLSLREEDRKENPSMTSLPMLRYVDLQHPSLARGRERSSGAVEEKDIEWVASPVLLDV